MLARRETRCDYSSEGSTGGAALAEKVEIIADVSQNMSQSHSSEQVDFMPQCSGSNCTQTGFLLRADFKTG